MEKVLDIVEMLGLVDLVDELSVPVDLGEEEIAVNVD